MNEAKYVISSAWYLARAGGRGEQAGGAGVTHGLVAGVRVKQPVMARAGSLRGVPVVDENSSSVESASLEVLQRLLCL
jgi:hypothetical protein